VPVKLSIVLNVVSTELTFILQLKRRVMKIVHVIYVQLKCIVFLFLVLLWLVVFKDRSRFSPRIQAAQDHLSVLLSCHSFA
jgi:hypothetical protein